jgi:hypothetical protein
LGRVLVRATAPVHAFPPRVVRSANRTCELLTPQEQKRNIVLNHCSHRSLAMTKAQSLSESSRYDQACDQAIAMCDGNLRSTIKALIMANEYLESELLELQVTIACGCVPAGLSNSDAA